MEAEKMAAAPLMSLSDFPENVIDEIISRLPTKDAGRTAVLSRSWRHRWRFIPDLDLSAVSDIGVSQALRLHVGPIRLFKFKDTDRGATDRWLAAISSAGCLHTLDLSNGYCRPLSLGTVARFFPRLAHLRLARSSISIPPERDSSEFAILQTLHLDRVCASYGDQDQHRQLSTFVPACPLLETLTVRMCGFHWILDSSMAVDYPRLTHLQLSVFPNFIIPPPSPSPVLASLRTLSLASGVIYGDLSVLFALCPSLENLTLKSVVFIRGECLGVVAPNLRLLESDEVGPVGGFSVKAAPVLDTAVIDIWVKRDPTMESCNLIKVLGGMPCIKRLHLGRRILMFMGKGYVPGIFPVSFDHLRCMSLKPDLDDIRELRVILCLLRSSPNLQELDLENGDSLDRKFPGVGEEFWKAQEHLGLFENLERVKMTNYYPLGAEAVEVEFVQFVLSKARVLKTMMVSFPHEPVRKRLMMFPRVSNQAKIIFKCGKREINFL